MPSLSSGPGNRAITIKAGLAVTILGGISAAISYTHIIQLAHLHHETGWRAHALPVSIDGLEVVASLVLLAEHRASQRPGHH
jgi:hypothetical protein